MMLTSLQTKLMSILSNIDATAKKVGRDPKEIQLVAVSKQKSVDEIRAVYKAGQRLFAENYLQEAIIKIEALSDLNIEWHFIGAIQSNKCRDIAKYFSWVHSICREKELRLLNEARPAELPPLNVCIQVNVDNENSKNGLLISELQNIIDKSNKYKNIKIRGLMAIPNPKHKERNKFISFQMMRDEFYVLNNNGAELDTISMGMSDDYLVAIEYGSTMVRIGTHIFGDRK